MGDVFWIGTACAISVVAGIGLGYLLDQWLGTTPWLTFAGLAFGITSAVLLTVRQLRRFT
jgi:F0F1-type ATP synthase assembly protein I